MRVRLPGIYPTGVFVAFGYAGVEYIEGRNVDRQEITRYNGMYSSGMHLPNYILLVRKDET